MTSVTVSGKVSLRTRRLGPRDAVRVGVHGLRTRPLRAFLSALGIAIGIAAMVAVVGISASSRAQLDQLLARLGTNLLTVTPGQTLFGSTAELPEDSVAMIGRIGPVESVSATGTVPKVYVYRTDRIPAEQSNSIAVLASRTDLLTTVGPPATARYPAVVLGNTAARRLGLSHADAETRVWLGRTWFTVIGILHPVPLAPELDSAALIGWRVAKERLSFDGHPTTVYERSPDAS